MLLRKDIVITLIVFIDTIWSTFIGVGNSLWLGGGGVRVHKVEANL